MKLTLRNESSYHTPTLRKIILLTIRVVREKYGNHPKITWPTKVSIEVGRTRIRWQWQEKHPGTLFLALPKLTGDEMITLLRQQHGGVGATPNVTQAGVLSRAVANTVNGALFHEINRGLPLEVDLALRKAKVPKFVPLRIKRPKKAKEKPDIVTARYRRVLALEAKWNTKLKLARTKLKKLRLKRKHYERKLNIKETK